MRRSLSEFEQEITSGKRFEFGKNWKRFLRVLNEERIAEAEKSLKAILGEDLKAKTFLDVGSGSGIFSLAARRLGARVHSFDYDSSSVACATELKSRYYPEDNNWVVERRSILDPACLKVLGKFDIVYSWGVLHHTGAMWQALDNACSLVKDKGLLFIAIYNNQGIKSRVWLRIKKFYCSGIIGRFLVSLFFIPYFIFGTLCYDLLRIKNPLARYIEYKKRRGMSIVYDWFDWLGGLPFEVAKPEEVFNFCNSRGFILDKLKTCGGRLGNNEFVFRKR